MKSEHSKRDEGMEERRRAPRIEEKNEVAITVASGGKNLPEEEINGNHTKDISVCGAKIQTNILLPVNTLLELDFTSKGVHQQIKILGKVKWGKVINENESYEVGVEFYPSKEMEKLGDYISWQLESNKSEFIKNKVSPIDSGYINVVENKKLSTIGSGNKNIEETKKAPPIKNKQWIKIAIISLGTIILIVVLLTIFGSISLDFIYPHTNKKVTNNFAHDSITTESATLPAPPVAAPAPSPSPAPTPEVTQKTKVIGNSDSKKYHLPGMKYYNAVKAYHRVEFDSETDAIRAGYSKAPR
jgi:PilZ domain